MHGVAKHLAMKVRAIKPNKYAYFSDPSKESEAADARVYVRQYMTLRGLWLHRIPALGGWNLECRER
jgi:hypothetical protein